MLGLVNFPFLLIPIPYLDLSDRCYAWLLPSAWLFSSLTKNETNRLILGDSILYHGLFMIISNKFDSNISPQ